MRGRQEPQVTMLAFVDLEERVPADHPLRTIKALADEALPRLSPEFDRMYADVGRPSIPPERLLKASLLIALYSVRSERAFCEELDYNLLFRWFLGMQLMERSFDPTVFTKNRLRLLEHQVGQQLFDEVVLAADRRSLLSDEHFTVDGTLIEAAASLKSFKPRDAAPPPDDGDRGNPSVDFHGERRANATHQSTTDPEARLFRKGKQLCWKSSHLGVPRSPVPEHGVEDRQQLVHTRGERNLWRLARFHQPLIEPLDHRVASHRCDRWHVEGRSHLRTTAPTGARSAELPAVSREGRQAHQGGDLLVAEGAQLRQVRQQDERERRPHARHTAQQLVALPPERGLPQPPRQVLINLFQLPVEEGDSPVDPVSYNGGRLLPVLLFSRPHTDKLAAAGHESCKLPRLHGNRRLRLEFTDLAEVGNHRRVEPVRLGQLPLGPCKVAHVAGVHHGDGEAGGSESCGQQPLVPTGGFHDDEPGPQPVELPDQPIEAVLVLGRAPRGAGRSDSHVQPVLRDIDADEHVLRDSRHFIPPDWPVLVRCGLALAPATVRAL